MPERIATIVLLVEDINQENLLRRYLQERGHANRNMNVQRLTRGRGSGEQFVRQKYAFEVRAIRSQMKRTRACLIAMIDADTGTVEDRRRQLDRALRDAEEPARDSLEPLESILNLIPKRNVETWILCLNSVVVDESSDYKHDHRINTLSIKQAAQTLLSWTRSKANVPGNCVPSLRDCLTEFDRLPD